MLGIVAEEPYEYGLVLRDAPRSMAILSSEHSDGWGLATHLAEAGADWQVHRSTSCACKDSEFEQAAARSKGRILLAHVRQKSVGPIQLENTHPFVNGPWVFAHNGTINDVAFLRANTSSERLKELRGSTDSELFFAWLLTRLDEAGAAARVEAVLRAALPRAIGRPGFGSINFLLSDGSSLYAHRFGRDLFLLDRTRSAHCTTPGALGCPGAGMRRRRCIAVASEPITPEAWEPLASGALVRVDLADAAASDSWRPVRAAPFA